ncbi:MAG: S41 family peptidase [Bacteroidota bacterium]
MPIRLLLAALLVLPVLASAQSVTVEIDLTERDLAGATVGLRGDTAPLAWDRSFPMEDPDGDGVYSATLAFDEGTGTVGYKAVIQPASGDPQWEPGGNRLLFPGRMESDRRAFGGAQTDLPTLTVSVAQLSEDLAILQEGMQALHPGLFLHNTEAELGALLADLQRGARQLAGRYGEAIPMSAAYLPISRAVASIRDGHTQVSMFNQSTYTEAALYTASDRAPFAFRLIGGRMVVTGDATPDRMLPPGTEVLSLDGRSVDDIVAAFMPYASADGSNDAKRVDLLQVNGLSRVAERFDVLYSLLYQPEGDLALEVRLPDGTEQTMRVPRMNQIERRDLLWARDETLPRDYDDLLSFEMLDSETAYLRIGAFTTFNMSLDYGEWLTEAFREFNERGAQRLVVDLRGNGGGMDDAAALLFAHLLREPTEVSFWQGVTAYDVVPENLRPHIRSWSDDFYDISADVTSNGDGTFSLRQRAPVTVAPAPDAFEGDVAVLVDAGPSSATFYLADRIQQTGAATLVGQTTGGSLKGLNGGQMVFLTLPNTGIAVDIPLYGSRPTSPGPDRGVIPDVVVEPDADAVIAGRDPELEAALAFLSGDLANDGPPALATPENPVDQLLGAWLVDLRPTPDSEVYTQTISLFASETQAFAGSFYGSPLESAHLNDDWSDVRIAFTTSDGSGTYHHSATLRGGRMHGTTHAPSRDLLSVWTAVRPLPLQNLAGDWAGTLTYTDYQDDTSRVTLTTSAEAEAVRGGIQITVSFVEPDGSSGGMGATTILDGGASITYNGESWQEISRTVTDEGFRLVIQREGDDNDRPATIRHTITLDGDVMTDRKQVRYNGTDAFFERNEFRFTR